METLCVGEEEEVAAPPEKKRKGANGKAVRAPRRAPRGARNAASAAAGGNNAAGAGLQGVYGLAAPGNVILPSLYAVSGVVGGGAGQFGLGGMMPVWAGAAPIPPFPFNPFGMPGAMPGMANLAGAGVPGNVMPWLFPVAGGWSEGGNPQHSAAAGPAVGAAGVEGGKNAQPPGLAGSPDHLWDMVAAAAGRLAELQHVVDVRGGLGFRGGLQGGPPGGLGGGLGGLGPARRRGARGAVGGGGRGRRGRRSAAAEEEDEVWQRWGSEAEEEFDPESLVKSKVWLCVHA